MSHNYKILLIICGFLYQPFVVSEENLSFQNISIQSDKVTIDRKSEKLVFKNNVEIKIDGYVIKGTNAMLNSKDQKLVIYGKPASITSTEIEGQAEKFEIYPNKSMNLIRNARLLNKGNSIKSNFITYQITANE